MWMSYVELATHNMYIIRFLLVAERVLYKLSSMRSQYRASYRVLYKKITLMYIYIYI